MEPSWANHLNALDGINGDRRSDRRYELQLDLKWKLIRRRKVLDQGAGFTIDVSSSGIMFECGRSLPPGLNVELSIAWPVLLHNSAPLQLVVYGKIVRSESGRTALRMMQHEFRTAGGTAAARQPMTPNGHPRAIAL
ncbi:MAG TPA: PilZ domain-containing protein [Bryobacteraceae bacterium]